MYYPAKRPRIGRGPYDDEEDDDADELVFQPEELNARRDPLFRFHKKMDDGEHRFKSVLERLCEKFGKVSEDEGDVINLVTGELETNNGHLQSISKTQYNCAENESENESMDEEEEEEMLIHGRGKPLQEMQLQPFGQGRGSLENLTFLLQKPRLGNMMPSMRMRFGAGLGPASFTFDPLRSRAVDPAWQVPDVPESAFEEVSRRAIVRKTFTAASINIAQISLFSRPISDSEDEDDLLGVCVPAQAKEETYVLPSKATSVDAAVSAEIAAPLATPLDPVPDSSACQMSDSAIAHRDTIRHLTAQSGPEFQLFSSSEEAKPRVGANVASDGAARLTVSRSLPTHSEALESLNTETVSRDLQSEKQVYMSSKREAPTVKHDRLASRGHRTRRRTRRDDGSIRKHSKVSASPAVSTSLLPRAKSRPRSEPSKTESTTLSAAASSPRNQGNHARAEDIHQKGPPDQNRLAGSKLKHKTGRTRRRSSRLTQLPAPAPGEETASTGEKLAPKTPANPVREITMVSASFSVELPRSSIRTEDYLVLMEADLEEPPCPTEASENAVVDDSLAQDGQANSVIEAQTSELVAAESLGTAGSAGHAVNDDTKVSRCGHPSGDDAVANLLYEEGTPAIAMSEGRNSVVSTICGQIVSTSNHQDMNSENATVVVKGNSKHVTQRRRSSRHKRAPSPAIWKASDYQRDASAMKEQSLHREGNSEAAQFQPSSAHETAGTGVTGEAAQPQDGQGTASCSAMKLISKQKGGRKKGTEPPETAAGPPPEPPEEDTASPAEPGPSSSLTAQPDEVATVANSVLPKKSQFNGKPSFQKPATPSSARKGLLSVSPSKNDGHELSFGLDDFVKQSSWHALAFRSRTPDAPRVTKSLIKTSKRGLPFSRCGKVYSSPAGVYGRRSSLLAKKTPASAASKAWVSGLGGRSPSPVGSMLIETNVGVRRRCGQEGWSCG